MRIVALARRQGPLWRYASTFHGEPLAPAGQPGEKVTSGLIGDFECSDVEHFAAKQVVSQSRLMKANFKNSNVWAWGAKLPPDRHLNERRLSGSSINWLNG